jgi:trehalose/maltose transport system substrate-binding protein
MFRSIGKRRRLLAVITAIAVVALGPRVAGAAEIAIACSALGEEQTHCRAGAQEWAERTGNTVKLISTPGSASEQLALYQQLLAAGADDIDVFQIDVVWPGILAQHFIDLAPAAGDRPARHFEAIIDNNTVEGRLVAMPWFADAGLLYYRADLLETHDRPVPETWEELTETARSIQEAERAAGNGNFWGYVWQGRAYEGLTTNALEWISSHGGGTFVDEAGEITSTTRPPSGRWNWRRAGSEPSARPASSTTPRKKRAACSSRARRCSCATGPMPGRWRKARQPGARARRHRRAAQRR